jgi:RNA polymerase sigma-70 factor (ECF subfamily)
MRDNLKQNEFLEVFEPVREKLYRFAKALCKSDELAKDIVSDTVLQAYENFEKIRDKQAFLSFVFTIASRTYKRYIWRRRLFGEYEQEYAENNLLWNGNSDSNYDVNMLYQALERLPKKSKEAIILFEISGFKIKEISEIQNCSESAVKSRLKRGREKLENILKTNFEMQKKLYISLMC